MRGQSDLSHRRLWSRRLLPLLLLPLLLGLSIGSWACAGAGTAQRRPGSSVVTQALGSTSTVSSATTVSSANTVSSATTVTQSGVPSTVLRKGPYLMYTGDDTAMTVLWQTKMSVKRATVEWGSSAAYGHGPTTVVESPSTIAPAATDSTTAGGLSAGADGHLFRYDITGLQPGAQVYYRVTIDGSAFAGSFRAAPSPDSASTVLYAVSDTQDHPQAFQQVIQALLADVDNAPASRSTICLHAGDFVGSGLVESAWDKGFFLQSSPSVSRFLGSMPVMGTLGNHEGYGDTESQRTLSDRGMLLRKYWPGLFTVAPPHFYYSFDYGLVHVAVLDTWTTTFDPDSAEYKWLAQDLASTTRPWKIVMLHNPAWAAFAGRDNYASIREYLCPLFQSTAVDLVIQGHDHFYSRCEVDGVQYVTIGGGGGELVPPDTALPHVVTAAEVHHFIRLDVTGDSLSETAISVDGKILDSFVLKH